MMMATTGKDVILWLHTEVIPVIDISRSIPTNRMVSNYSYPKIPL
jgi:hypothetical protein